MSKCLIIIDHSFRTNSFIFKKAISSYKTICVVYVSNYYLNDNNKNYYKNNNNLFYYESLNYFSSRLKENYDLNLKIIKSKNPVGLIEDFCKKEKIEKVYYDKPLFSEKLRFNNIDVEEVDSDSYIDSCTKMTAKSRWIYWTKNRLKKEEVFCNYNKINDFGNVGELHKINHNLSLKTHKNVCNILKRFKGKVLSYHETRNKREGSTKLSKFLHHGLIDPRVITHLVLSLSPMFIEKDNPIIPVLRQLAFREICIRKCRIKEISFLDSVDSISKKLLDEKSYNNLLNNTFTPVLSKKDIMNGNTKNDYLNKEIKQCIKNRWMPNRSRMWFAGECYWNLGGGLKSLETLIDFFNTHCEDAQSPNNIVNCVESFKLQYGKVMRFNQERTLKLLND